MKSDHQSWLAYCTLFICLVLLFFLSPAQAGWQLQAVTPDRQPGTSSDIALDRSNHPHILYYHPDSATILYARWTGSAWNIQIVDSGTAIGGGSLSIALDASDVPHISYAVYISTTDSALKYAQWTGVSWSTQTVIVGQQGWQGWYSDLAVDAFGNPHISYYNGSGRLKYAQSSGASWSTQTVDASSWLGMYSSIALDSSGNPHISYCDYDKYLKYARWTGSRWETMKVDFGPDPARTGAQTSLVVDSEGNVHISYTDIAMTSDTRTTLDVKYAYGLWTKSEFSENISWSTRTVAVVNIFPGTSVPGFVNAIAVDRFNNPHLCYFSPNDKLQYAKKNGDSWTLQQVDANANQGCSITIDSFNNPYISYQSAEDSGDLNVAVWVRDDAPPPGSCEAYAFPNPFLPDDGQVTLQYILQREASVRVDLYDLLGEKVRSWSFAANQEQGGPGIHRLSWDGNDANGRPVLRGIYFASILAEDVCRQVVRIGLKR